MKPESRTLLHVTAFICIFTLLLMTACGVGTDTNVQTESALVNDIASQTDSNSANGIAAQTDSDSANGIAAQTDSGNGATRNVTILATSDMHANVMSFSYEDNAETEKDGMARLYTYIKQQRHQATAGGESQSHPGRCWRWYTGHDNVG